VPIHFSNIQTVISLTVSTASGADLSSARNPPFTIRKTDNLILCPSEILGASCLHRLVELFRQKEFTV
jgi:hypothetical protein